jgi:multidrug efflux pump subunit AcrA (membrane-fusion protein)
MASKTVYSVVAVLGIAAASGAAWWYQSRETGPREITGASGAATPTPSGAPGASGSAAGGRAGAGLAGVEVAKAEGTRLQDDAQSVGSLRSKQNVILRPEVSGRIQTLGFTDGARVRRGETLVQLEDTLQRAEVRQAEAQVSIARANLRRNQELVAQNFVAQRVVDESSAQLQVQEAQLSLACARWERMRVIAPFDGTVGIRSVNVGDYVRDGADLVNLEDLSSMYVDFRLPERFIGKIRREQQVELQLDAMPGRQFKAKIEAIDPQIDANGRSVSVRAVLPNTGGEPIAARTGQGGPGGPGGAGGSGPIASGAALAAGGRPTTAGAAGATGAANPAAGAGVGSRPAATVPTAPAAAARPAQRPASLPVGASARPADAVAASCAPFSSSGRGAGNAGGTASAATAARPAAGLVGAVTTSGGPSGPGTSAAARQAGPGGRPSGGGPGAGSAGGPLRPGMFARVTAVFNVKDNAVTVPEEALVPQGGRQFVFKLVEQTEAQGKAIAEAQAAQAAQAAASAPAATSGGGAGAGGPGGGQQPYSMAGFVDGKRLVSQRIEVKTGIRRPGRVEITEGLSDGDTVVIAGQQRLQRDNTPVRVVELGRPPGGGAGGAVGMNAPAAAPPTPAASR